MGVWLDFSHFWSSKKNVGGFSLALPLSDSLVIFSRNSKYRKGKRKRRKEIKFTKFQKKFRARERRFLEVQIVPWRISKKNQNYSLMFLEVWIRVADGWMTVGKAKYQKIQVSCFVLGLVQDPGSGLNVFTIFKDSLRTITVKFMIPSLGWIPGIFGFSTPMDEFLFRKAEFVELSK